VGCAASAASTYAAIPGAEGVRDNWSMGTWTWEPTGMKSRGNMFLGPGLRHLRAAPVRPAPLTAPSYHHHVGNAQIDAQSVLDVPEPDIKGKRGS
jgi:hypothetical protein